MYPLLLNSIEIENFRAFKSLKIDSCGRVNLIVGKNSVGKSSLLEAVQVYATRNHEILWQMLVNREEGDYPSEVSRNSIEQKLKTIRFLYHGRQDFSYKFPPIQIGEIGSKQKKVIIEFKV
jgi:AAA15 family ATPase/GTPase